MKGEGVRKGMGAWRGGKGGGDEGVAKWGVGGYGGSDEKGVR